MIEVIGMVVVAGSWGHHDGIVAAESLACVLLVGPTEHISTGNSFHKYAFGRAKGASVLKKFCQCEACEEG